MPEAHQRELIFQKSRKARSDKDAKAFSFFALFQGERSRPNRGAAARPSDALRCGFSARPLAVPKIAPLRERLRTLAGALERGDVLKIARVFPRRTNATPDDELAFTGPPPKQGLPDIDEIHVSVAFSYDMEKAEQLAEQWSALGVPVKMGGPAFNSPGGEFVPGLYLRQGFVVTSRGCPNRCWFCSVPKREGFSLRELPVTEGWNVVDDNLLACSDAHIHTVFAMLKRQEHRPVFTGGLEAKLLKPWHVDLLRESKTQRMYFAYDTPDDLPPLMEAGRILREGGITKASHRAHCYVLIGYQGDTMDTAEQRLRQAWQAGFLPFAMLYRDEAGNTDPEWRKFQRLWARPAIVYSNLKKEAANSG